MYFVYVLLSEKDKQLYTGFTENLQERVNNHFSGKVVSTRDRRPLLLVYYEGCIDRKDAFSREIYLKSGAGKDFLKKRLRNFYTLIDRGVEQPGSSQGS